MRKSFFFRICCTCLVIFAFSSKAKSQPQSCYLFNKPSIQTKGLNKNILNLGLNAYEFAIKNNLVKNHKLVIVDYTKPSNEKRLWIINMKDKNILFNTLVTHGKYSGNIYANRFSNKPNSFASSFGVFLTKDSYYGRHGYSLRLKGLENGINDNAYKRTIVIHKAQYANSDFAKKHGRLGRSWGCFALPEDVSDKIIDTVKEGSVLFAYYPDSNWLNSSRFLQNAA